MKSNIFLRDNNGFKWVKKENLFVRGYIFDLNEQFYQDETLADYFSDIETYTDFEERVSYANGCYSVIYIKGEKIFAACDCIRSLPLFYTKYNGEWVISDDSYYLSEKFGKSELNEIAAVEFLATGYVTGDETLIRNINQIQAGEIIRFEEEGLDKKFYFTYRTSVTTEDEYDEFREQGIEIFNKAFKRFIASLDGRTVVVPLSGGFDSRMIVTMLKKYEYDKVICFTYGRKGNPEIEISKKVAETLGFKWIYIEYTEGLIENFLNDTIFLNYYKYAGKLVSMFFMQEYFAVKYLKENKLIPEDSIFAPGHSGDFLGGSQLFKHDNLGLFDDLKDVAHRIYNVKYCYLRPETGDLELIHQRIQKSLEEKFTGNADLSYSIHEDWDFKEKLAKFNFNSLTTYTYFGYEFRFPYWDNELLNFFKKLPLHVKINKFLYDDILIEEFFKPLGLNFPDELQPSEITLRRQKIKDKIKHILPEPVNRFFMDKSDDLFYNEITQQMVIDSALKGKKLNIHGNYFNSLIIQWYLDDIKRTIPNSPV